MNGIIAVNKPCGFTSFDVVAVMRGVLRTKKVGHSGTLDPMAEGVLPIFTGSATKAISLLPDSGKSYRAGFALGLTSDTLDIWGNCSQRRKASVSEAELLCALEKFKGETEQVPPMYSALKVNGRKLCDLARQGIEVERKPRKITITSLSLVEFDGENGVIDVDCSSGTYIRSLVDDIGAALGVGAVMSSLVRTRACGFSLADCHSLEELKNTPFEQLCELIMPIESVFADYPEIRLDDTQKRLYLNGVRLDLSRVCANTENGRLYRIFAGEFLGVAAAENGELVSKKRFNS